MEQYEIRRLRAGRGGSGYAVVLQSSFAGVFDTCVIAPLVSRSVLPAIPRLRPLVSVEGEDLVIVVERLAAVDRSAIGPAIGSAEHLRDEITRALDLLFTGF